MIKVMTLTKDSMYFLEYRDELIHDLLSERDIKKLYRNEDKVLIKNEKGGVIRRYTIV